jgi:hypothetical protein
MDFAVTLRKWKRTREREGDDLLNRGLYLGLPAGEFHLFAW